VLIFGLILKRFLNFRQASGEFVSKNNALGGHFFLYRVFCGLLFKRLFIFLFSFLFRKQKNKQKNF
jgi:hypothetical protein